MAEDLDQIPELAVHVAHDRNLPRQRRRDVDDGRQLPDHVHVVDGDLERVLGVEDFLDAVGVLLLLGLLARLLVELVHQVDDRVLGDRVRQVDALVVALVDVHGPPGLAHLVDGVEERVLGRDRRLELGHLVREGGHEVVELVRLFLRGVLHRRVNLPRDLHAHVLVGLVLAAQALHLDDRLRVGRGHVDGEHWRGLVLLDVRQLRQVPVWW